MIETKVVALYTPTETSSAVEMPNLPTFTLYRRRLETARSGDLLAYDVLDRITDELIEASCMETPEPFAARHIVRLAACYPQGKPPEGWFAIAAKELTEFAPDIVRDALVELRRTSKFIPSVAEIYQAAKALQDQRDALYSKAMRQMEQHEEREERRKRQEQEERERQERIATWEAEAREKFGDDAVTWDEYSDLSHAVWQITHTGNLSRVANEITPAVRAHEPWSMEAVRRFRVMQRAMEARPLPEGWGLLVQIAWCFYECKDDEALARVEAAERGEYQDRQTFVSRSAQETARGQIAYALEERTCTPEHREHMAEARWQAAKRAEEIAANPKYIQTENADVEF